MTTFRVEHRPVHQQIEDLVVVPDLMRTLDRRLAVSEKWDRVFGALSADDECQHGRLPGDPSPACGCFGTER